MNLFMPHDQDRQSLQALHNCRMQEKLIEMFRRALSDTKDALVKADDPSHVYRLQGRAKALEDFLAAVEKSGEVLE